MGRFIDIKYKCRCMDGEATFQMRERRRTEDIADYMRDVQVALGKDHRQRSPLCVSDKTDYLKIQIEPDGQIGSAKGGTA